MKLLAKVAKHQLGQVERVRYQRPLLLRDAVTLAAGGCARIEHVIVRVLWREHERLGPAFLVLGRVRFR